MWASGDGETPLIDCGTLCTASVPPDPWVELQAIPEPGFTFYGWSGECEGSRDWSCSFWMDCERAATALFGREPATLEVLLDGGAGIVRSTPAGIECGGYGACSAEFPQGTSVTLSAEPAAGWVFAGWSGACAGTERTCVVDMSVTEGSWSLIRVTARFAPSAQIFVTTTEGVGTVSSDSGPCHTFGPGCIVDALPGAIVDLVAHPAPGWAVDRWSGACTGSGTRCSLSPENAGPYYVQVSFVPAVPVEVQVLGPGTVSSPQAEFTCRLDESSTPETPLSWCVAEFAPARPAEINAIAEPGFRLRRWAAPCQWESETCVFTPWGSTLISAIFSRRRPRR